MRASHDFFVNLFGNDLCACVHELYACLCVLVVFAYIRFFLRFVLDAFFVSDVMQSLASFPPPPCSSSRALCADFLMQYVKKDKLTELLAEKLCARLASSDTPRQSRAVSYCLGQLKVRYYCCALIIRILYFIWNIDGVRREKTLLPVAD